MKDITKMILCMIIVIIFGVFAQIFIGNSGAPIVGGILIFAIGCGWYARGAKSADKK